MPIWRKAALSTFSGAVWDFNISSHNHIISQLIGHEAEALSGTRWSTMIDETSPTLTSLLVRSDLIAIAVSDGPVVIIMPNSTTQINVRKSQAIHPSLPGRKHHLPWKRWSMTGGTLEHMHAAAVNSSNEIHRASLSAS